ncbi:permease [Nocardia panacis]|uniref:Permease n=1 Tax=Nocardia panacis TaxID=2340916 RepID=A0A3A4K7Q2_9NOCA|nr:permease [Nocardia panacis]RJO69208.1 permease [Nocardia panacis]
MTGSEGHTEHKPFWSRWRTRVIGALAAIAVLIGAYFILAAFIPRWWAQRVGSMVDKSFSKGILLGLGYGALGTLIPLLLILFAVFVWRRRAGKVLAGASGVLAVLTAVPNLMTLTIVLGTGSGANAGRRILDVEAPAFRGAALVGAIVAAAVFVLLLVLLARRHWRGRKAVEQTGRIESNPASRETEATRREGM